MTTFEDPAVEAKFATYTPRVRRKLLALRKLILKVARTTPGVGDIEETLKWGEPAYVTKNRSGSTLRIDWKPSKPDHYAMYFNCQTNLVETFRSLFPHDFEFQGNRALLFAIDKPFPKDALLLCIEAALTYHQTKRRQGRSARIQG